MALVLANRVQETGTANTTVSFTLTGAVAGFQSFAAIGNTNTTYYAATDASGNWEVGLGTYATSGPTLTRTTVYASSNSGSAVTFSGTCNIFVTYPSGSAVYEDASGNVSPLGTITSGVWNGSTIPVAYGGTGVTASTGASSVVLRDANQNIVFNNYVAGFTATAASAGTTVLTVASARNQILTGSTTHTFQMPDATTLSLGQSFLFVNNSSGLLTITNNATAVLDTIPAGGVSQLGATNIGTSAGTFGIYSFLPGSYNFNNTTATFNSATISSAVWNGTTIASDYGGTGLTTFTAANNALYSTSSSALAAGTLPVAAGGTGASSASITAFNNITGYSAAGATGTTTTSLVFSTSPTISLATLTTPTATGQLSFSGSATTSSSFHTTQTSGAMTIGGSLGTGNIVVGRSTVSQQTDIQAGATASGSTKTINLGTGGLAGSTTAIAIGSTAGTSTTTLNGTVSLANALAVAQGGTGATSQTAYAVLCGGTTSTGAYQSIAGVGTTGQVLTSNGAGALPTFQTAGGGVTLSDDRHYQWFYSRL